MFCQNSGQCPYFNLVSVKAPRYQCYISDTGIRYEVMFEVVVLDVGSLGACLPFCAALQAAPGIRKHSLQANWYETEERESANYFFNPCIDGREGQVSAHPLEVFH